MLTGTSPGGLLGGCELVMAKNEAHSKKKPRSKKEGENRGESRRVRRARPAQKVLSSAGFRGVVARLFSDSELYKSVDRRQRAATGDTAEKPRANARSL
jgi:hypothetical protein